MLVFPLVTCFPPLLPLQPCYKWWEPPYFWAGLRMYDLIAGKEGLEWCRYLTPSQVGAATFVAQLGAWVGVCSVG